MEAEFDGLAMKQLEEPAVDTESALVAAADSVAAMYLQSCNSNSWAPGRAPGEQPKWTTQDLPPTALSLRGLRGVRE